MIERIRYAWAINTQSDEGHGVLGVYWFTTGPLAPCQDGMRTALFSTKKEAVRHIKERNIKRSFPKAKAVRVKIIIEAVKHEKES